MTLEGWGALAVVLGVLVLLSATQLAADYVLLGAVTLLIVCGIVSPADALSGLSNPGLVTVAALFVVVAGLVDTGAVHVISRLMLGRSLGPRRDLLRVMLPVTWWSAFLNNTPVVAMMVPMLQDWCRRHRISVSRFMMPLSYAAILGGSCTLVGSSTNLIVHGMVLESTSLGPMSLFSIAWVGVPMAAAGTLVIVMLAGKLLPERKPPFVTPEDAREYAIELLVEPRSSLVGQTIEGAGLRHLPGAFVAEIERGDGVLPAVSPHERLQANDRLVFVGILDSVADLVRQKGLTPVPEQVHKLDVPRPERRLVEAVISDSSPMRGQSIREGRFRSRYGAVVIAVARNGERVTGKLGDIVLQSGDTLLLEARPGFLERQRNSREFLLVSALTEWTAPRHERAGLAIAVLVGMVVSAALGWLSMLEASLTAAGLMLLARCTRASTARQRIDWALLIVIGASLGVGRSLQVTGAAGWLAGWWIDLLGQSPFGALVGVYVMTAVFTAILTNSAAAAIVFPVAMAVADGLQVSFWPFIVVIMVAASASFATPIGYQTNLMVYGPGGYRYSDYIKLGLPVNLVTAVVALVVIPIVWPF